MLRTGGTRGLQADLKPMTTRGSAFSVYCTGDKVKVHLDNISWKRDTIPIQNVLGMFLFHIEGLKETGKMILQIRNEIVKRKLTHDMIKWGRKLTKPCDIVGLCEFLPKTYKHIHLMKGSSI